MRMLASMVRSKHIVRRRMGWQGKFKDGVVSYSVILCEKVLSDRDLNVVQTVVADVQESCDFIVGFTVHHARGGGPGDCRKGKRERCSSPHKVRNSRRKC